MLLLLIGAVLSAGAALLLLAANELRRLELSLEEARWLREHAGSIRIAPLPDSPPIDFVGEDGFHRGLTSDYIHLIERQLGITFTVVRCESWEEIITKLKAHEVDVVGSIQNTQERREFLHFTEPYLSIPNIILTRNDTPGRFSLHSMEQQRIAIVNRSATHDYLKSLHPEYDVVPVKDASSGFQMVSFNEVDVMIADQGVASYYIAKLGITNLRVAGDINYPWELCLASRTDWPILNQILDKALANITWAQRRHIHRKWISLSDAMAIPRDDYLRVVGGILLLTLIVIGSVVFWNRLLHRQVTHRTMELGKIRKSHEKATHALDASETRFRILVESTNDMIWEMDRFGNYSYVSPRVRDILGYDPHQLIGQSALSFLVPADAAKSLGKLRKSTVDSVIDCYTNTHVHRDGRHVILESNGMAFADAEGNLAGFRGVSRDITDRVESDAALAASEERFRNLVETTSDWIWEVNAAGRFIYASPQALQVLGYSPTELIGRRFMDLMVPKDAEAASALFEHAVSSGESIDSMVNTNLHKSGRSVVLETSAVPFYDEAFNIQGYRGIGRDITDRMAAEKQLEFERGLFRSFMDHAPHIISFKDREGRFIEVNRAKAEELKLDEAEVIGKTDTDFIPAEQAYQIRRDENEVMRTEIPIQKERKLNTPSGERWYLTTKVPRYDERGRVVGTFGTSWNITQRKKVEEDLRQLRALLSNIIDSMPSILVGVDRAGCVTQWNREAEQATGIVRSDAAGKLLADLFPELSPQMTKVERAISERQPQTGERIQIHEHDQVHFADVTVYPLLDHEAEGAVIRMDDVTDRVRLEEMMVQSEKMLSVGGLAAGMAHEINNPLAGILQNMQVMRNRVTNATAQNAGAAQTAGTTFDSIQAYMQQRGLIDMMDSVTDAGERAAKIVDNMLSFSRKDNAEYMPHDIAAILECSVELASNDYNLKKRFDFRHIRIDREYDRSVGLIPCEKNQIQQVILNLLTNSAQAMAQQDLPNGEPSISIRLKKEPDMALIEIEDNGPGMDEATRKRVFEPFFTTKDVGSGTGLGLSVSYFIVTENHGGLMQVEAEQGKGTCFSIRIPFTRNVTAENRPA